MQRLPNSARLAIEIHGPITIVVDLGDAVHAVLDVMIGLRLGLEATPRDHRSLPGRPQYAGTRLINWRIWCSNYHRGKAVCNLVSLLLHVFCFVHDRLKFGGDLLRQGAVRDQAF